MSKNELCGLDEDGEDGDGTYDASGVIALTDAIEKLE